ncbi:FlgO family outer membrane protein [Endozoicomonas montiporae]|uniref:FlgO domain-containing protein n=1 Tax=Endozoicomonas montiporae CL-33 TaxID=570277 RepID=A0A142BCY2_9GAMM|nr:FlgO family outer membrane protein [Endozoicomonas montiporae]AMO56608.1 hypothetical protein EZMO1_2529 [Endozoicomonas montiporae CL-33]
MSILFSGCQSKPAYDEQVDLVEVTVEASERLADKVEDSLSENAIILSTSLSNIDNLSTTSTLGRIISEQLASGLMDQGFRLKEIKMRSDVFIREKKVGNLPCPEDWLH